MACRALHTSCFPSTMECWAIADGSSRLIVTEPRRRTLNSTTQAGPDLQRAIRDYVRAYAWRHGRRKAAEDLRVPRHTLWRFLERGHTGRAVPSAVLNAVGGNVAALEAATLEIIIDLEGLRPDPALRPLQESLEEALLLLCATPLAAVDELSRFGRVPASTLRERLEKLAKRGLVDSVPHHLSVLGSRPQRRYFPTERASSPVVWPPRAGRTCCVPTRCRSSGSGGWPSGWMPWPCSTASPPWSPTPNRTTIPCAWTTTVRVPTTCCSPCPEAAPSVSCARDRRCPPPDSATASGASSGCTAARNPS